MTPARRAKIKALAEDARGNQATRAIAQRVLERYPEPPEPPRQQRVSGIERSPEYLQFIFMDLNRWKRAGKSNLFHITSYKGRVYKFVIFKSTTDHWGWKRRIVDDDSIAASMAIGFETCAEAHRDAWKTLQMI